jgi:hypothetical protein
LQNAATTFVLLFISLANRSRKPPRARPSWAEILWKKHSLRALDALYLASALFLRERVRSGVFFSSFDERLNEAAQAEGLAVPGA